MSLNSKGKPQFKKWTTKGLADLQRALAKVSPAATAVTLPEADTETPIEVVSAEQRAILIGLIEAASVAVKDVLIQEKITDLAQLPAVRFDGLKRKLNLTIDKNLHAREQKEAA